MSTGNNIFNIVGIKESLASKMTQEMKEPAEPILKKAVEDAEHEMRKRLGSMVIALLESSFSVDMFGQDIRILVKHIK